MSANDQDFQRTSLRYRFDDTDMDTFFVAAMGWGKAGGLDVGELYAVAQGIADGDGQSWAKQFSAHAELQRSLATGRLARGHQRGAAEALLKASASLRSAWQFCSPGEQLTRLLRGTQATFREAVGLLGWPTEFFGVPYEGAELPALLLRAGDPAAPTLVVVGGADSALENIFFTIGRGAWERGLSVAIVDLPGSNATALDGLHWTGESERPVGAMIDCLLDRGADPARLVLVGFSLGGYWAVRAAGQEPRLAACVASTPFPEPRELFGSAALAAAAERGAQHSNTADLLWKGGADSVPELAARMDTWIADPADVRCPFLSIAGAAEPPVLMRQALDWHQRLDVRRKDLIVYDQASGADAHCQINNPTRMMQDVSDWVAEVVGGAK
jgi:pimeloyl-ACP methyl ester carboxylesterase